MWEEKKWDNTAIKCLHTSSSSKHEEDDPRHNYHAARFYKHDDYPQMRSFISLS